MDRLLRGIFIICFGFAPNLFALNTLQKIETKWVGGDFFAELHFDKAVSPESPNVEFINQTIQINIPNAEVPKGQLRKKIGKKPIRSVFSYQYDKDKMRARIILDKNIEAKIYKNNIKISGKENILRIHITDPMALPEKKVEKIAKVDLTMPPVGLSDEKRQSKHNEDLLDLDFSDSAVSKSEKKKESEIPVFTKKPKKESKVKGAYSRMIYSLLVIVLIGAGLVVATRKWSKKVKSRNSNTQIKVLTQHYLGPKKSLAIIRVAGESILIGVTEQNISLIKSLAIMDEELPAISSNQFEDYIDKSIIKEKPQVAVEETTVSQIKDIVASKLKEMRPL